MSWRPIKAIVALRKEVQRKWPADRYIGIIGDASHASRVSDHNPDASGEVHAIDVGIEGLDVKAFLKGVIGDPRVWYVIHDRKIWSRTYGWRTRAYTGANPHTGHVHVSFRYINKYEDDTSPFFSNVKDKKAEVDEMPDVKDFFEADEINTPYNFYRGNKKSLKANPNLQFGRAVSENLSKSESARHHAKAAHALSRATLKAVNGLDVNEKTVAEEMAKLVLPDLREVVSKALKTSEGRSAKEVADEIVDAMGDRLKVEEEDKV